MRSPATAPVALVGATLMLFPGRWYVASATSFLEYAENLPDTVVLAKQIACPTLFLRGDKEPAAMYPGEAFAANAGGKAELKLLPGCDHFYTGCYEAAGSAILDFLQRMKTSSQPAQRPSKTTFQQERKLMADIWNKYALTKARTHGKPGKQSRPKSITIDVHSHIGVPKAAAFAKPHLDPMTIPLYKYSTDATRALNAKQDADRTPCMIMPQDKRLKDMDEQGVDMQLVMPPPPTCYFQLPIEIASKALSMANEEVAEYVAKKPDRFCALGHVPLQDGEAAAKELERCMKQLKFKGVQILTNINGKEISDPSTAPFWKKAEELGAVVLLHPNGFTQGDRFTKHYFSNIIGNPFDTTMALHYLIFDGVLERHPKLKIISVHGGGYLAGYSGRIDHAWGARSDVNVVPQPPTSYLKRNVWVDSVVFSNHQLETLVKVFGPDHVVLGTDYPYDMAEEDPVGHICNAALDESTKAAVCGLTAKKLLGL